MRPVPSLVAACYSRICRPPTSGGTGGSLPRGAVGTGGRVSAPPKRAAGSTKSAASKKVADSKTRFNRTAFTKKVEDAIRAEPALMKARRVSDFVKARASAFESRVDYERSRSLASISIKITNMKSLGSLPSVDQIAHVAKMLGFDESTLPRGIDAIDKFDRLNAFIRTETSKLVDRYSRDPEADADTTMEKKIKSMVRGIMSDSYASELLTPAQIERWGGNPASATKWSDVEKESDNAVNAIVSLRYEVGRRPYIEANTNPMLQDSVIDEEFEAASTRVGKIVLDEIQSRVAKSKELSDLPSRHAELTSKLKELVPLGSEEVLKWDVGRDMIVSVYIHSGSGDDREIKDVDASVRGQVVELIKAAKVMSHDLVMAQSLATGIVSSQVFLEVMSEVRPMGGILDGVPAHRKVNGGMSSNEQANYAASMYPADWIDASNMQDELRYGLQKSRQHYSDGSDRKVSDVTFDAGNPSIAVHEMGHRMEHVVPGLVQLEKAFYERRTAGEQKQQLRKLLPKEKYGSDEVARPDKFYSPYCGKDYGGKFYELITMGMEAVATRYRGPVDDDYAAFVLGALSTVYREGV